MKVTKNCGTIVSKGICIAEPFMIKNKFDIDFSETENYEEEFNKFKKSLRISKQQLTRLVKLVEEEIGKKESDIFKAQIAMLEDNMMIDRVVKEIKNKSSAEAAVCKVKIELIKMFNSIENEYIRNKSADIKDIMERVLVNIKNDNNIIIPNKKDVVILAEDLTPSQTISFDNNVKGIITEKGSSTSHAAILAKSLNIPAIIGMGECIDKIQNADIVILDTIEDNIILNPDEKEIKIINNKINEINKSKKELILKCRKKSVDINGVHININANIGCLSELDDVKKYGAEGIGLLRTEFLYMNKDDFPDEDEQFKAYKKIVQNGGNEVILRTLDIGGDKELSYYEFEKELNPSLGNRSIRFSLDRVDIFKTQLRAVLRASAFGDLKIMYPLITAAHELRSANKILDKCKAELESENIEFDKDIKVGIMIETPAAALMADELAKEADFFSIGTNDLFQYTMAVDRTNNKVWDLYKGNYFALLKLIKLTYEAAKNNNIEISVCGEMAGQKEMVKKLLDIGIRKLSMSPSLIPIIIEEICSINN